MLNNHKVMEFSVRKNVETGIYISDTPHVNDLHCVFDKFICDDVMHTVRMRYFFSIVDGKSEVELSICGGPELLFQCDEYPHPIDLTNFISMHWSMTYIPEAFFIRFD